MEVCQLINFPVAEDKMEWASETVIFLGLLLNGKYFTLMIPEDKRKVAINILDRFAMGNKVTIKEVQMLTGTLNFLTKAIVPGRVFTRRMYNFLEKKSATKDGIQLKKHHHIKLSREFKNDCEMWLTFLRSQQNINRHFIEWDPELEYLELGLYTDSSRNPNLGFGCYLEAAKQWTFGKWEENFIQREEPSIAYLELFALCVAIFTWEEQTKNANLLVHCDNEAVVTMVNNTTSSCKNCMYLLRMIVLNNIYFNRRLKVVYIQSKKNSIADSISRLDWKRFWSLVPKDVSRKLQQLPKQLWPLSKIWQ